MDPSGGINPSAPRLDNQVPVQPNPFVNNEGLSGVPVSPVTPPTLEAPFTPAPVQLPTPLSDPIIDQQPPKQSGGGGKKIALIIAGVCLVGLIGGGAFFIGFTTGQSKGKTLADAEYQKKQAALQQETEDTSTEETPDPSTVASALEIGELQDPKYVDETLDGVVGKQLVATDGLVIKVTNIERNFKSTDTNYKLDATKELVKVNFLMGNITKGKTKDISSFSFRLENSANAQLTPENIAEYADKFDTTKLEPGAQAKGSIVYAVNKDEKPLKFVREQRYRISGENREVTTRVVVTIAK